VEQVSAAAESITFHLDRPTTPDDVFAFQLIVLMTLGYDTTVRTTLDPPNGIRIFGGSAEDLVRVAEAFVARSWRK
jgi:hypothetical protein